MSGKYNEGREAFLAGDLSWTRDEIVAQLVSKEYVFSEGHKARDLKGRIGKPVSLDGRTSTAGWAKSKLIVFKAVSGPEVAAVVFLRETKGQLLIAHIDEIVDAEGKPVFPMTPNGGDIEVEAPEKGFFRL